MKSIRRTAGGAGIGLQRGWSLVELLVVIMIIGLLIGFMAPRLVGRLLTQAKVTASRQQMDELKKALVGDPNVIVNGEMISVGYRGDAGAWPPPASGDTLGLTWLMRKPPSVPAYNPFTHHGWNGPYIRSDSAMRFLDDAWGNPYRYIRDSNNEPIGLESAGPDGNFAPPPPEAAEDNIQVRW
jgi:general secretion pathway protein G